MDTLQMDFEVFFYMIIGIFGLVGFTRGWWKEALTTGSLVFLVAMLEYPELAETVVGLLNTGVDWVSQLLINIGLIDTAITPIDPANPQFYIITLLILIIGSYFIGKSAAASLNITVGGRLFGAMLGLFNGFVILSLIREYVIARYLPNSGISTAATPTNTASVTIANVPQESAMDGVGIWILLLGGLMLFGFAIVSRVSFQKGKVATRPPIGYK